MKKYIGISLLIIGALIVIPSSVFAMRYIAGNPTHFRDPSVAHHHMRMQLSIEGEQINFSDSEYQETYVKGQCTGELTESPIHFHDDADQMVHIHWSNIRGGDVLKYYGLNQAGGAEDILGYRTDENFFKPEPVEIKGDLLPDLNDESKLYVYTKEDGRIIQREAEEFQEEDLETFFGQKSQLTIQREEAEELEQSSSLLNVNTYAQEEQQKTQEDLEKLQNLIGDVVIFAQEEAPSIEEVEARFDTLIELNDSTCGG